MPSLLNTVKDLGRLRQIVIVLAKHGFGEVVQRLGLSSLLSKTDAAGQSTLSQSARIRLVLEELGPSFVKLGQILSTRSDLIPEHVVLELEKLQEHVPSVDFEMLRPEVEKQLGASLEEIFETFDAQPLASASIAQVHRAVLNVDGEHAQVAVKIQRPNIGDTIERDIDLLYWLAHAIERSMPELRAVSPLELVREFDRAITAELDFTLEADNAQRFAENFRDAPHVRFPGVYLQASSRTVLTLEYLDGYRIDQAVSLGFNPEKIAKHAVAVVIKQIFEDGFFHADPHPGNIILLGENETPIIGMIDLGLVGRLSPQLRDRTIDLMVAAVERDPRSLADAVYALSRSRAKLDRLRFEADITEISDRYLGKKLKSVQLAGLVSDLIRTARQHQLQFPPDFLMVGKALMTVEGIGKRIYPELDIMEEVKPYFLNLMWQRYAPDKIGRELMRGVSRLGGAATDMPLQLQDILEDLRQAKLTIQVREPKLPHAIERLSRRIFSGLIVSGWIIGASILVADDQKWLGAAALVSGLSYAVLQAMGLTLRNELRKK